MKPRVSAHNKRKTCTDKYALQQNVTSPLLKILLNLALAIILIAQINTAHAAGLYSSNSNPTRFGWMSDPQTLYVRPGNTGQLLFNDSSTSSPSNLHPWQDEYCNATWVDLDSPRYPNRITAQLDEQSTQSAWARLTAWMQSLSFTGTVSFWIIDDDLIARYKTEPALADQLTSQIQRYARFGINEPTLVVKPTGWSRDAARLIDHLRRNGFTGMIGAHITKDNLSQLPPPGWDFIIYDTSLIPTTYRGQAAANWIQSRHGFVPVILAPSNFDFQRDITWIGSGAAGIWYPPLPTEPKANAAAATHLRASTTFLNRFSATWLPLSPRPTHPAFHFTLENSDHAWAAVIPSTAPAVTIPTPANLAGKIVGGTWYNPATDQTIIQPLTRLPSVISVQRPDASLWIYSLSAAPEPAEDSSHIAPIRDWTY